VCGGVFGGTRSVTEQLGDKKGFDIYASQGGTCWMEYKLRKSREGRNCKLADWGQHKETRRNITWGGMCVPQGGRRGELRTDNT